MLFEEKNNFLILSQHFSKDEYTDAIATSNVLLYLADRLQRPIIHLWALENTVILGHMDAKLKSLPAGLKVFKDAGYNYVIRNAGGLGVVSDDGVINISFYFPNQTDVSINDAYDGTTNFMQDILQPFGVQLQTGEVTRSYCPGTYDLSVNEQKISGQAQRRSKNNIAVMLYLSLDGPQVKRGEMMHNFYEVGNQPAHPKLHYPDVDPKTMTNLNQVTNKQINEGELFQLLIHQLVKDGHGVETVTLDKIIDDKFISDFEKDVAAIEKRTAGLENE